MAKKKYKQEVPTPMVSEPGLSYQTTPMGVVGMKHSCGMSVDEYFDKVKKALDKRYEDIQRHCS
jgi:hypothetical protein